MPYDVIIHEPAAGQLKELRAFDRQLLVEKLRKHLVYQPSVKTRNRKPLGEIRTSFKYAPPLWELRVGEFRVFYDIDGTRNTVNVRSVRRKRPSERTEDIL